MMSFTFPRWHPPGLSPLTWTRFSCSGSSTPIACRLPPIEASTSYRLAPVHGRAHESGDVPRRRRSYRRPRTVTALGASIRENAPDVPGAFDPARCGKGGPKDGVRDKVELLIALKAMGRRFEWRGALKVFQKAKFGGVIVDNSVYSCIIGVMAKSGRWSEAVELLEEAADDGHEPNKFCFTAAVSACAKGRNWKLALSLLEQMRDVGLEPDHVTYGAAVSAMAKTGQWQRALDLLQQMAGEGLQPNVVCYGAAVDACAKGGQWERAVALLEEMRAAGVEPDRICYNTAVNACAQTGEWGVALAVVDKMRQTGDVAPPDSFTFNSVMYGMASVGDWERLLALLNEMRAEGVAPDVVSYNTAMGACNKACQHERALSVFEDMRAAGVAPDKESFSAATEACAGDASGGMGVRAIGLMEAARQQGLRRPWARAVAATLAACVGRGYWRRAVPAVEKMIEASGPRAWDDVMKFLTEAQLGRDGIEKRADAPPTAQLLISPREEDTGVELASARLMAENLRAKPRVNGHDVSREAAEAPPPG